MEEWHRFGKVDSKSQWKETIVRFIERRFCKKVLLNRKKLTNLDNSKYNFSNSKKIFVNKNISQMNESIAFKGRKLKTKKIISAYYTKNSVVHVKKTERSKAQKNYMSESCELFPGDVYLEDDEREELFHDPSQDDPSNTFS